MAKSQKNQIFVLKVNTGYLSKNNWHLTLKLSEIRKQPQLVVSLGSSQVLRWMPELTGKPDADIIASAIKQEIKHLKRQGNTPENKKLIRAAAGTGLEKKIQPGKHSLLPPTGLLENYSRSWMFRWVSFPATGVEQVLLLGYPQIA